MAPKIVDRKQRQERILNAAFEIFCEKGYHKTTLADIARATGIGQGTLYYYFPTKEEIFWGTYDVLMSHIEQALRERVNAAHTPHQKLEALIQILFSNFPEVELYEEEVDGFWKQIPFAGFSEIIMEFMLQAIRSGKQETFYQRIAQQQEMLLHMMQELLMQSGSQRPMGFDLDLFAHFLIALRDGLSFQLQVGVINKRGDLLQRLKQALLQELQRDSSDSNED